MATKYITFLIVLYSIILNGQRDGMQMLFPQQFNLLNPARIGLLNHTLLGADFNTQWLGISGAPRQQFLFFEIPNTSKKSSYGALLSNYNSFTESRVQLLGQFSYWIRLNKNSLLRMGIKAGIENTSFNFEELKSVDKVAQDPLLKNQSFLNPNLGIGAYLIVKNYFISIALPRLLQYLRSKNKQEFAFSKRLFFLLRSGRKVQLSQRWLLKLSAMVYNFDYSPLTFQFQSSIHHQWGGLYLSFKAQKAMTVGVLFHEKKFFSMGYSYQFNLDPKNHLHGKNHSLTLLFRLENTN